MIDFQNKENLIFILIIFFIGIVLFAILIFIIYSIFKFIKKAIKKIFQKNDDLRYAENLEVAVPELEESKQERQKIAEKQQEFVKNSMAGPKLQYYNNPPPPKNEEQKDPLIIGQKQIFDERDKKDIEKGLNVLKKSGKDGKQEENDGIFAKIKIPRAKKVMPAQENIGNKESGDEKQPAHQPAVAGKIGDESEALKAAEIKIPKTVEPGQTLENKAPDLGREKTFSEVNKIGKTEPRVSGDDSIFGGKSEVSRIELRQKLRYDPKIYKAQREAGLFNLNRITRAKLEKDIFPTVYGRNISKTDLKWNLKRLGREWASETDVNKKGVIRKEIKFLKKIGGIK